MTVIILPSREARCQHLHDDLVRLVRAQARASVSALYRLMELGLRPRDIMTERAFENAITTVYAMGGSTNMYLHLLAIAREAQVPIGIERRGEALPGFTSTFSDAMISSPALTRCGAKM
jgi:dihydroxyacid dehydratase/phosphogluconate dehydratase